uniref:Uncharacterized protein n=1 Tax=Heterorhabditis bacteriophora TaxID=37862 RepID=A0A1I7X2V3_HETBA
MVLLFYFFKINSISLHPFPPIFIVYEYAKLLQLRINYCICSK